MKITKLPARLGLMVPEGRTNVTLRDVPAAAMMDPIVSDGGSMLIKAADHRQPDLDALTALLAHPDVDARTQSHINQEIRAIRAGAAAEHDAAYEIEFHLADRPNWAVIHDLRLEVGGGVAQIDHLLIDRLLRLWVCESKHFAEGVSINEHGEWHRYWRGRRYAIASPVEQNRRHIMVVRDVFDRGLVALPHRLGITLKPAYESLILIANNARITRPRRGVSVEGLESVIKVDQLRSAIERHFDEVSVRELARVIGRDTLERFARDLAALHRPAQVDWTARFGLLSVAYSDQATTTKAPLPVAVWPVRVSAERRTLPRQPLVCEACGKRVSYSVASYCAHHQARFSGRLLCLACQKGEPLSHASGDPLT